MTLRGWSPTGPPSSQPSDAVSLAERMAYMQAVRASIACIVLASGVIAPKVISEPMSRLSVATILYAVSFGGIEALRRLTGRRGLSLVFLALLIDGVFLAWIMYATGGTQSPLRFLTYLHLIAVTLLTSYRTGLKTALWHSLLFFCVFYAQAAASATAEAAGPAAVLGARFKTLSVLNVLAFWAVAVATAALSTLNERELRKRRVDFERLATMATEVGGVKEPPAIARLLLENLSRAFGFQRGVVLGAPEGEMRLLAAVGTEDRPQLMPGRDAVVDEAWTKGETLLLGKADVTTNPRLARLLPFAGNLLITPLYAEREPLGVVVLEQSGGGSHIERRVVAMAEQFARHASLALRNAWLLEQIQQMAETDALTGVGNRRRFETILAQEMSRASRLEEALTVVLLDVDHFKAFNDSHGHQAGDKALRAVAQALASECRDFDSVARYGGEEFAVILPTCSAEQSLIAAERLRKAVSKIQVDVPVTASAGVATYPTHVLDEAALIEAADECLYESKRAGRNMVTRSRRQGGPRRTPAAVS